MALRALWQLPYTNLTNTRVLAFNHGDAFNQYQSPLVALGATDSLRHLPGRGVISSPILACSNVVTTAVIVTCNPAPWRPCQQSHGQMPGTCMPF
jgi:hypothetical protein